MGLKSFLNVVWMTLFNLLIDFLNLEKKWFFILLSVLDSD